MATESVTYFAEALYPERWSPEEAAEKVGDIESETATNIRASEATYRIEGKSREDVENARLRLCQLIGVHIRRLFLNDDVAQRLFNTPAGHERLVEKLKYIGDMNALSIDQDNETKSILIKGDETKNDAINSAIKQLSSFQGTVLKELRPNTTEVERNEMLSKTSWNTAQVREVTEARDVKLDDDIMEIASHAPYKKDIQLAQDFASKIREIAERLNAQVELNENLTAFSIRGNKAAVEKVDEEASKVYKRFKRYVEDSGRVFRFHKGTIWQARDQHVDLSANIKKLADVLHIQHYYGQGERDVYLWDTSADKKNNLAGALLGLENLQASIKQADERRNLGIADEEQDAKPTEMEQSTTAVVLEPGKMPLDKENGICAVTTSKSAESNLAGEQKIADDIASVRPDGMEPEAITVEILRSEDSEQEDTNGEIIKSEANEQEASSVAPQPDVEVEAYCVDEGVKTGLASNPSVEVELLNHLETIGKAYDVDILYVKREGGVQMRSSMVDSLAAALTELQRYVNEDLRDSLKELDLLKAECDWLRAECDRLGMLERKWTDREEELLQQIKHLKLNVVEQEKKSRITSADVSRQVAECTRLKAKCDRLGKLEQKWNDREEELLQQVKHLELKAAENEKRSKTNAADLNQQIKNLELKVAEREKRGEVSKPEVDIISSASPPAVAPAVEEEYPPLKHSTFPSPFEPVRNEAADVNGLSGVPPGFEQRRPSNPWDAGFPPFAHQPFANPAMQMHGHVAQSPGTPGYPFHHPMSPYGPGLFGGPHLPQQPRPGSAMYGYPPMGWGYHMGYAPQFGGHYRPSPQGPPSDGVPPWTGGMAAPVPSTPKSNVQMAEESPILDLSKASPEGGESRPQGAAPKLDSDDDMRRRIREEEAKYLGI